jgi:kinesin family protein 5
LSESLGGNSKTCLIITASPSPYNDTETLSTFRFGQRARSIKNAAKVNREYTVPELQKLLERAENEVEFQKTKVKILEGIIKDLGGKMPSDFEMKRQIKKLLGEKADIEEAEEEQQEKADTQ